MRPGIHHGKVNTEREPVKFEKLQPNREAVPTQRSSGNVIKTWGSGDGNPVRPDGTPKLGGD